MLGSRPLSRTTAFAPRRDLKREKPFHQERPALFVASPNHNPKLPILSISYLSRFLSALSFRALTPAASFPPIPFSKWLDEHAGWKGSRHCPVRQGLTPTSSAITPGGQAKPTPRQWSLPSFLPPGVPEPSRPWSATGLRDANRCPIGNPFGEDGWPQPIGPSTQLCGLSCKSQSSGDYYRDRLRWQTPVEQHAVRAKCLKKRRPPRDPCLARQCSMRSR